MYLRSYLRINSRDLLKGFTSALHSRDPYVLDAAGGLHRLRQLRKTAAVGHCEHGFTAG